jgi:Cu2+-exporting ATPase
MKTDEIAGIKVPRDVGDKYYCPMHCEGDKVYDKPGNCTVCV